MNNLDRECKCKCNSQYKLPLKEKNSLTKIPAHNTINIIVADDEIFTRQSTVRVLKNISKSLGLNINILEAEDGIETLYMLYKTYKSGSKISFVFSDQNMEFMDGIKSSLIVKEIVNKKQLLEIPFYLVTAYDESLIRSQTKCTQFVTKIFNKPILKNDMYTIFENFMKCY